MIELAVKTYTIVLPIVLGYIVWLLQQQKIQKKQDAIERDERIKEERELREANSKGTMLLLRVKLIEYHEKYTKRGSIPNYAYENFNEMYEAYHALGGNGMVTHMKEEIEELKLKKESSRE